MTQDEIIHMAREAGFTGCLLPEEADDLIGGVFIDDENWAKPLERFAALVAAHEREKQAEQEPVAWWDGKETAFFEHELYGLKAPAEFHIPLYAAPVRTKDLTDDELREIHHLDQFGLFCDYDDFEQIARAVIAAYKEKNK